MTSDLFPTRIETDRLQFEPFHEAVDAIALYELHRTGEMDEVMRLLGDDPDATPKEAKEYVDLGKTRWNDGKAAFYAVFADGDEAGVDNEAQAVDVTSDDRTFLGSAELFVEWEKRLTYFGLWLREPFWGRGYSGERAGAMFVVAFDHLDLDLVSVGHEPDNEQSRRAIEKYITKYGGQHDASLRNWFPPGDFGGPRDLDTYTVTQSQWCEAVTAEELASIEVVR